MKIPNHLIKALLNESPSFREYAASVLGGEEIRNSVKTIVSQNKNAKVNGIKALREFSRDKMHAIRAAFPEFKFDENPHHGMLLVDAKNLFEMIEFPEK